MRTLVIMALLAGAWGSSAQAQPVVAGATVRITRATGPIKIDGDLSDEAWRMAARVDKWYEVQPGDNTEPPVKSTGYLTYDDRALYVAFDFEDPHPEAIRAPFGDHDSLEGVNTDFGGLFVDALNTGRAAVEFFVSPHNIQYDAVTDDATGENSSPDFFWASATKITSRGWTLEMRIPFSTLRYNHGGPQQWRVILLRNYPRQFRYQFASVPVPRGSNCTVCRASVLTGLEHLPTGGGLVVAPYASVSAEQHAQGEVAGAPLSGATDRGRAGLDVKYNPNADTAIDAAVKPDFSQIESDTAQISANERFALFYPEKRPFFLEGVDLLQTPMQAVYTRTITSPEWGGRITGKTGSVRYTALAAEDAGGGTVIIPGSNDSSTAPQDFASTVFVGRAKREIGRSFIGALVADREIRGEVGHNRVIGPDFEWRPSAADVITGQWLYADTRTPNRPEDTYEWDGRHLAGGAAQMSWSRNTRHFDWYSQYNDVSSAFRADTGFMPQVGYREAGFSTGWTVHPKGFISRERTFLQANYQADTSGAVIDQGIKPGFGMDTRWNGFVQVRYNANRTRAGDTLIDRNRIGFTVQFAPSRRVAFLMVDATVGQDIDFANARPGTGGTINLEATLRPTDHLALDLINNTRWLDVTQATLSGRLFTQRVSRVKATYTFTSRMFVRLIAQDVSTTRDPALYASEVASRSRGLDGSALFAYKLNWQSVLFVGYGDDRALSDQQRLEPVSRQLFVKLSYAFQR